MSKRKGSTLSRNLMKMKFMQKSVNRDGSEGLFGQQNNSYLSIDEDLNENLRKEGEKYYLSSSYLYCEHLKCGRMSFKGMNHEIEKLMQQNNDSNESQPNGDNSFEVSDEEMTKRYSYLIDSNPSNVSNRKRGKYSHKSTPNKRLK